MEATAPLVVAAAAAGVAAAACCCQPTLRPAAPRIPRPAEFRRKREALVRGGARNLAVISDFDLHVIRIGDQSLGDELHQFRTAINRLRHYEALAAARR